MHCACSLVIKCTDQLSGSKFAICNSQRGLIQIQDTFGHRSPGVWSIIRDSMQYNLKAHLLSPELLQIQLTVFEEALPDPKMNEIHPVVPDVTNSRMEDVYKKFQS